MTRLSLSKAWDESRRIFASEGRLLIAVALGFLVLPEIVAGLIAPPVEGAQSPLGRIVTVCAALVGIIGQLAIIRLAIGPSLTVGQAIGHGARRFPAAFGAIVIFLLALMLLLVPLMAILVAAGVIQMPTEMDPASPSLGAVALLLVVALLFLSVKFIMTVPVASAEEVGPLTILKRSWVLTRGSYWLLLGFELLLLVAGLALLLTAQMVGGSLGELAGGISPFSTGALILAICIALAQGAFTVLASLMLARVYVQLAGRGSAEVGVPSTGT